MKGRIFSFLLLFLSILTFTGSVSAQITPSFPSCNAPSGNIVANYQDGTHGIVGDSSTHTGSDIVYSVENGNALQCFCNGSSGIQTNWWKISDLSFDQIQTYQQQGYTYIPSGEAWGLENVPYLAQNNPYACNQSSNNGNTNNGGVSNGGSSNNATAPVCNDTAPNGAPAITNVVYGFNSVTLTWTKAANPVSYYLVASGTQPGKYDFGNPNVGGPDTTSYTINGLSSGVQYYFAVRAGNGCMPGPFSNEGSASNLSGDVLSGPAAGFDANVLGTSSGLAKGISTEVKNICAQCFWWPILLGEALVLVLYYFLVRRKPLKINRVLLGAIVAILAYVVFLFINKGHICPIGGINLYFFSIPCKYFWAVDGVVYVLLTWFTRKGNPKKVVVKPITSKKTPKK